jgi:hypothetical protein
MKINDIMGKKFGRLTPIRMAKERNNRGSVQWDCLCDCGKEHRTTGSNLRTGNIKSCGCLMKEVLKSGVLRRTHGLRDNHLYHIWVTMKGRCSNKNNPKYLSYGARGITISEKWNKFENFFEDMSGSFVEGLQLDRIDNNKGYSKENCRWATRSVQARNRRDTLFVDYEGKKVGLHDLCDNKNIKYSTVHRRMFRDGWSLEKALITPIKNI